MLAENDRKCLAVSLTGGLLLSAASIAFLLILWGSIIHLLCFWSEECHIPFSRGSCGFSLR